MSKVHFLHLSLVDVLAEASCLRIQNHNSALLGSKAKIIWTRNLG